ncbi:MAG: CstA-like transporter-associated (seleno)protein [Methylophilus sp.]|nr:YbdD/YjiX family protein [Methylophilus sp.]
MTWLKKCWQRIRELSGDDGYERYLAHYAEHHAHEAEGPLPLSRTEYFKQWQDKKWQGIKRCC